MPSDPIQVLCIKNLRLRTRLGCEDWEFRRPRETSVQIEIAYDASRAVSGDSLQHAINYEALCERIHKEFEDSHFYLIETLADRILAIILEDERVVRASVQIEKPGAVRYADGVSTRAQASRPAPLPSCP